MKKLSELYPQYYKGVPEGVSADEVDTYVINLMFPVDDYSGCILHARKKLLIPGVRSGGKSQYKDVKEARDTLNRYLQLLEPVKPMAEPVPAPATEWQLDGKTFARLMTSVTAGFLKMTCTNPGEMPRDYRLPIETFILDGVDIHFWNPDGQVDPSKTTEPAKPEEKPLEKLSNSIPELQDMFKELIEKTAMDKSQVKPLLKVNPGISSLQLKPVNVEPTDK